MTQEKCEKCGGSMKYHARHWCVVRQEKQKLREQGFSKRVTNETLKDALKELGFELRRGKVGTGWTSYVYGYYARPQDIAVATKYRLPNYSNEPRFKKIWETEEHLAVIHKNYESYAVFKKDTPEETKKRKFLINKEGTTLYTIDGYRFAERCPKSFVDIEEVEQAYLTHVL